MYITIENNGKVLLNRHIPYIEGKYYWSALSFTFDILPLLKEYHRLCVNQHIEDSDIVLPEIF